MFCFSFEVGVRLKIQGRDMKIYRIVDDKFFMEDCETLATNQYTRDGLHNLYLAGEIEKPISEEKTNAVEQTQKTLLSMFPETVQKEAIRRKHYVDKLCDLNKLVFTPSFLTKAIRKIAELIGDNHPPSATTVWRWFQQFTRADGDPRSLIPRYSKRGGAGSRAANKVQELIEKVLLDFYLTPERRSIREAHYILRARIDQENAIRSAHEKLKMPSYSTLKRAVAVIPKYEVDEARYGKRFAQMKYRTSMRSPSLSYPLERVEVDHTPIDLFIIDEETYLPLGRPWITSMIDCHTTMLMGFYVSFSPPSVISVFNCLENAVKPKSWLSKKFPEVKNDWPCCGLMNTLVCDNGLEFHAKDLERACFELGVILQFCPKKKPYFKGPIERYFKTLSSNFLHSLSGTSFSNWMQRHDYDPEKNAVATFSEFLRALHIWVVDIYSHAEHRTLKTTPYAKWRDSQNIIPLRFPMIDRLEPILGLEEERVLWHYGVELHGLKYNSHSLFPIRHQLGERVKVKIRYSPDDLGCIYVIHPETGEAILVPALFSEYANGLRLEQHKLIQADLRLAAKNETNESSLAEAKQKLHQVIGEMLRSKRLRNRKQAIRRKGPSSKDFTLPNVSNLGNEVSPEPQQRVPDIPLQALKTDLLHIRTVRGDQND